MINLFIKDTPQIVKNVITTVKENKFDEATRLCHTLKSMAGIVGAKQLNTLCSEGEHSSTVTDILQLIPELEEEAKQAVFELREYLLTKEVNSITREKSSDEPENTSPNIQSPSLTYQEDEEIQVFDIESGIYNSGCEENFKDMVDIFKNEVTFILQGIEFESLNGNTSATLRHIHTLKNMAGIIGAARLCNTCTKAEVSNDYYVVQKILPILKEEVESILQLIPDIESRAF